jgi:uncharacterized protein YaiL (DUF2058 family)
MNRRGRKDPKFGSGLRKFKAGGLERPQTRPPRQGSVCFTHPTRKMADDLDGNVGTYGVDDNSGSDSESFELAEPEPVAPVKKGKGAAKAEAKAVKGDKNAKNSKKRKAETDGEELLEEQKRLKKKQKRKEEKKRKSVRLIRPNFLLFSRPKADFPMRNDN